MISVLLVDDEPDLLEVAKIHLERSGSFSVDTCESAPCALSSLQKKRYDAIIADYDMPDMTGLELVRMLADKGCHAPPQNKIVISSLLSPEQEAEFNALGCHFLPKPFELAELWQLVESCAENTPHDRQLTPVEDLWKTARDQQ